MDVPASPRPLSSSSVRTHDARSEATAGARAVPAAPSIPFASLLARSARAARGSAAGRLLAPAGRDASRGKPTTPRAGAPASAKADGAEAGPLARRDGEGSADDERDGDGEPKAHASRASAEELDSLDPLARHAAHLAPPGAMATPAEAATSAAATEPVRARSLEELLPVLVRRIAWAGDRHRGTVRLELGAGAYAGTSVVVHADGGRVRVELGGNEGPELDGLRARLETRLRAHGLDVESVT